jgi:phosphopantothenoylcysteine decarboxylase/phosphopantothenate--cysteine ligase
MLKGKNIILGITGSIAAYKAATLVRLLIKEGANVKVIMTEMAKQFITPLTMATLSKNPILVDFYNPENGDWNSHVSLGMWADLYLIAPASANTIAKMNHGVADNLLLTTYLSARCPIAIAPAMDLDMYNHPSTQKNLTALKSLNITIIEPGMGELASGLMGKGRMEEPELILKQIETIFEKKKSLLGKKVIITAGPTVEQIDPVRFISNNSTGKMGYSLANELFSRGANVTIVSGPVDIVPESEQIEVHKVKSAKDMLNISTLEYNKGADIIIFTAAVADYTPIEIQSSKIKKEDKNKITLELTSTPDIAKQIGNNKKSGVFHVGFALETDRGIESAKEKLKTKNFDIVVLNSLKDKGAGFATETNKITIIDKKLNITEYPLKSKKDVANDIIDYIESQILC